MKTLPEAAEALDSLPSAQPAQTPAQANDETPSAPAGRPGGAKADGGAGDGDAKAYLIEIDGVDAGLAVMERGGYRFVAASPRFSSLDGSRFNRLGQVETAAERLLRKSA